ncbi:unnamed protein product [Schistosoma margrebowiei]|uniref:Uncharacterized protein n=1 Tax=Schistosoma margrebowiei TaxID=48269 RepID=A0A183MBK9_9TREM|nr:unnamed protein product [Schistosoma margrebowiei]
MSCHKKNQHKGWITADTLNKIQERRNKKAAINISRTEKAKKKVEHTAVNKQVKRSIRTDNRKYVEDFEVTEEKAARGGNIRQMYIATKTLFGNYLQQEGIVEM